MKFFCFGKGGAHNQGHHLVFPMSAERGFGLFGEELSWQ